METFKLHIDAISTDGDFISLTSAVKVDCTAKMASSIIFKILQENEDLKDIILDGVILYIENKQANIEKNNNTSSDKEVDLN